MKKRYRTAQAEREEKVWRAARPPRTAGSNERHQAEQRIYIHQNGMTEFQMFSHLKKDFITLHSEPYPRTMGKWMLQNHPETAGKIKIVTEEV